MLNDIFTLINFFKYKNKITRVFFFENNFIEYHLAPYTYKNVNINETILVSLYKIKNAKLKRFKIFQFQSLFFLNLFFLILKTKYCYSSTPDIDNSAFQRSIFKKTKYIYIQHSPLGLNKIYRHNAFTHFDVVHVINSFQKDDLIDIAKNNNKKIKAWKSKYLYLSNNFHSTPDSINMLYVDSPNTTNSIIYTPVLHRFDAQAGSSAFLNRVADGSSDAPYEQGTSTIVIYEIRQ